MLGDAIPVACVQSSPPYFMLNNQLLNMQIYSVGYEADSTPLYSVRASYSDGVQCGKIKDGAMGESQAILM